MIDYNQYTYTATEWIRYGLISAVGGFAIFMLFYDSIRAGCVLAVLFAGAFLMYYRRICGERRRWELTIQFKDAMESLVSALVTGYSLENAVSEAQKDLAMMYDADAIIMKEFMYMSHKIELKVSVEALMQDLGKRSGVEDIITFSEILSTAKKTGGNIAQVMRRTGGNIAEKIEMKREMETMIAGKKMEARFMTMIPLLMIVYLRLFSPGFLDPLYHNITGILIMTAALIVYAVSFFWGQKIMAIQF